VIVLGPEVAAAKASVVVVAVVAAAAVGAAAGVVEKRYIRAQTLRLCFEGQTRSMARRFAVPGKMTCL